MAAPQFAFHTDGRRLVGPKGELASPHPNHDPEALPLYKQNRGGLPAHWLGLPGNAPGYAMVRHGSDDYHEHWLKEPAFKLDDVLAGLIQATPNDVKEARARLKLVSQCWTELKNSGHFTKLEDTLKTQTAEGWEAPQALFHIGGGPWHEEGLQRANLHTRTVGDRRIEMSSADAYQVIAFQLADALFVGRHFRIHAGAMTYSEWQSKDQDYQKTGDRDEKKPGVSHIDRLVTASLGFTIQPGFEDFGQRNPIGTAVVPTLYMDGAGAGKTHPVIYLNKDKKHALNVSYIGVIKMKGVLSPTKGMTEFLEDKTFVRTADLPSFSWHDMPIIAGYSKLYWMPKNVANEADVNRWLQAWQPAVKQWEQNLHKMMTT